jgi:hypothetical protein
MKLEINPELSVVLGDPAYTKDGTPVYDDHRFTENDKALIEAAVAEPTKTIEELKEKAWKSKSLETK